MSSPQPTNRTVDVEAQTPEQVPMENIDLQTSQPPSFQPMNPQKPHPEGDVSLRGGDRGGMCPGRFCFCVPCPLPCDFCII